MKIKKLKLSAWWVVANDGSGWGLGASPELARAATARERLATMRALYGPYRRLTGGESTWSGVTDTPASIRAEAEREPVVELVLMAPTRAHNPRPDSPFRRVGLLEGRRIARPTVVLMRRARRRAWRGRS